MARVKLSEFQAKRILLPNYLGFPATPTTTTQDIQRIFPNANLVVKVDQGIKKRSKLGLVKINVTPSEIPSILQTWTKLSWSHFLIEPVIEHAPSAEHYLSLERMRGGWQVSYSNQGGIEVESSWDSVKRTVLPPQGQALTGSPSNARAGTPKVEGLALSELISPLISSLEKYHIVFLECNPILIRDHAILPLDMAAEIDDTALGLSQLQTLCITPIEEEGQSQVEKDIARLDSATPASLKFKLINPKGKIWMLLSGGGASLVLADEVADQGMGADLANYGEYSGSPTNDDVYSYTQLILSAMLQTASRKPRALVIAAGVANFTDVAKTFQGIIRALATAKSELKRSKVKIFVRRGGPNESLGLKMMEDFLLGAGIPHIIHTHETPITQVISEVKEYL